MNVRMPMGLLRIASKWYPEFLCFGPVDNSPGRMAITFDDGPHEEHTPRLLDVLGECGLHATFFFQGVNAKRNPDIVLRARREGHQIALHGQEHVSAHEQSAAGVLSNANRCHATLVDILGTEVQRVFRPPYGDMTLGGLRMLSSHGYRIAYWSYDSNDSFAAGSEQIVRRFFQDAPEAGSIVLFHDDCPHTVKALPAVVASVLQSGLTPVTVAELWP